MEEAVKGDHRDVVKQLISFGADSSAEEVFSLALKSPTSEVVRILAEVFAARDAGEHVPGFVEVAAKCEALLLADSEIRAMYW